MQTNIMTHPAAVAVMSDGDQSVTTLALLIRKTGISAALFSRYWRDVHGVLAARIPGFESYTQYHLGAPFDDVLPVGAQGGDRGRAAARFDGLAEVTFKNIDKRLGLATSDVTAMIQEDERNVFRTSLLYNLTEGASRTVLDQPVAQQRSGVFILLGGLPGCSRNGVTAALDELLVPPLCTIDGLLKIRVHVLLSGEQQSWQTEGVENQQTADTAFDAIVQLDFGSAPTRETIRMALAAIPAALYQVMPRIQVYPARACHVMVEGGRPTELGLRGLDAQRTIAAAGAANQRSDAVLRCVYGASVFGSP
jgi:hypothetical protein